MSNLLSRIENDRRDISREQKKNARKKEDKSGKGKKRVSYGMSGKVLKGKMPVWKKVIIGIMIAIGALAVVIYVPPFFYKESATNNYTPISPDPSAIKAYLTYLKDNPDADFDQDGLSNALEEEYKTSVWNIDSDNDAISDYAELFITETSPTKATADLQKKTMDEDKKNGEDLGTPYKMDDIIFWANDYFSKAYGAVVRTPNNGYRFYNFDGYVRFPSDQKLYAYGYENGIHFEIPYKKDADAWRITDSSEIILYTSPLRFVNCLNLPLLGTFYFDDDGFGNFLTRVLPDKGGPVTCYRAATIDTEPDTKKPVTAELELPFIKKDDTSRLGRNMNSLADLNKVMKTIDKGYCMAVSMYSANVGESIGIIYGYTNKNELLVANEELEPVGKIKIRENAKRMMDKDGYTGFVTWFEWAGLGFDSARYGDRISFFSTTELNVDEGDTQVAETETQDSTDATKDIASNTGSDTGTDDDVSTVISDDTADAGTNGSSTVIPDDMDENQQTGTNAQDVSADSTNNGTTQETTAPKESETTASEDVVTFGL